LRIHEVPVDWIDDPDSRVDIVATAVADLKGVARLLKGFTSGDIPVAAISAQFGADTAAPPRSILRQGVHFAAIGIASTAAYLVLFLALSGMLGSQGANLVALLVTAVANTAANRRYTFGVRGSSGVARHQLEGLVVFGIGLGLTSGALALLHTITDPHRAVEVVVLVAANLLATVVRFVLLRGWVFHPRRTANH
jgi:putative flippase GtrA